MHTPGPWEVCNYDRDSTTIDTENGTTIAYLDRDEGEDWEEEIQANARLIAAAPVMFEELRSAEQTLRNLGNGELTGDAKTIALNAARNICKVIEQAKNER